MFGFFFIRRSTAETDAMLASFACVNVCVARARASVREFVCMWVCALGRKREREKERK